MHILGIIWLVIPSHINAKYSCNKEDKFSYRECSSWKSSNNPIHGFPQWFLLAFPLTNSHEKCGFRLWYEIYI